MDELQTRPAARAGLARKNHLLADGKLVREVRLVKLKPFGAHHPGIVLQNHLENLATAANAYHPGVDHLAEKGHPLPGHQAGGGFHLGPVFIAKRQEIQAIFHRVQVELFQELSPLGAHPLDVLQGIAKRRLFPGGRAVTHRRSLIRRCPKPGPGGAQGFRPVVLVFLKGQVSRSILLGKSGGGNRKLGNPALARRGVLQYPFPSSRGGE